MCTIRPAEMEMEIVISCCSALANACTTWRAAFLASTLILALLLLGSEMKSLVVCSRGVRYVTASQPSEAKSRLFHSGLLAPEPQGLGPKRRAGISPSGSFIAAPQAIAGL